MKARINLRDVPPSLFVLFLEGPTVAAVSLAARDDFESFESFDETKELSDVPKEIGPLCDLSRVCPSAPS